LPIKELDGIELDQVSEEGRKLRDHFGKINCSVWRDWLRYFKHIENMSREVG